MPQGDETVDPGVFEILERELLESSVAKLLRVRRAGVIAVNAGGDDDAALG